MEIDLCAKKTLIGNDKDGKWLKKRNVDYLQQTNYIRKNNFFQLCTLF